MSSLLLMSTMFNSCQKEQKEVTKDLSKESVTSNITSWLDRQGPPSKSNLIANIELLKRNLELNKTRREEYKDADQFIIIPINKEYNREKRINEKNQLNLLVVATNSGEIKGANIVEFIPENGKDISGIPENAFRKIFNKEYPGVDGLFRFLSVTGRWLNETTYKNK